MFIFNLTSFSFFWSFGLALRLVAFRLGHLSICWLFGLQLLFLLFFLFFCEAFLFFLLLFFKSFLCSFLFVSSKEIPDADLALIVPAKAVDASRFEEDHRMVFATSDLDDMIALVRIKVFNFLCVSN